MSDDKHEHHDDPNEIRADIDQTRAAVGEKIDQLQARLDPSRLKQQATETVNEILNDTATSVTEYVRSHRDEMVTSVADAARRNPLPTALVGLGLGWLILESMAGSKRHDDDSQYERRNLSPRGTRRGYEGNMGRSRGQYIDDEYFNEEYATYGPPNSSVGSSMGPEYRAEYQSERDYGNGKQHHSNPVAKAAGAVKDTVSDVSQGIKDRVSDVGQDIKERVEDAGHEIKERMSDVKDRVGDMTGRVGDMSDQAQYGMQKAGYRMEEWQQRARYEGQRRGQQVVRNLEDNPLIYGAVALAAGAALALFLPSTRTESRAFGEMRDQVMDKGKEVFETAKSRAQEVITEVRPELEEKARQIVSDAKEMGKEIVKDAADEIRPVVDKAVAKTKEEAKNVAQELGVDPNKLTSGSSESGSPKGAASMASSSPSSKSGSGSSMGTSSTGPATMSGSSTTGSMVGDKSSNDKLVVNRDILRGQWTQLKGEIKSKWGQLTDDELTRVEGDMEKLIGTLQTRYGYARARAEQEVNDFFKNRSV
jgi:uncharacterized protein YjbJ (UPF0337 family)/gas vesicle protein